MDIKFKIISEEEFDADHFGSGRYLTALGGCSDYGNDDDLGLGDWQYEFVVTVTVNGEEKTFTVAFQPLERNNGMMNYSGYDITTAHGYGCDADQSPELEEFCEYDTTVLDRLHAIAGTAAENEHERLMSLFEAGEIDANND